MLDQEIKQPPRGETGCAQWKVVSILIPSNLLCFISAYEGVFIFTAPAELFLGMLLFLEDDKHALGSLILIRA